MLATSGMYIAQVGGGDVSREKVVLENGQQASWSVGGNSQLSSDRMVN